MTKDFIITAVCYTDKNKKNQIQSVKIKGHNGTDWVEEVIHSKQQILNLLDRNYDIWTFVYDENTDKWHWGDKVIIYEGKTDRWIKIQGDKARIDKSEKDNLGELPEFTG